MSARVDDSEHGPGIDLTSEWQEKVADIERICCAATRFVDAQDQSLDLGRTQRGKLPLDDSAVQ